MLAQTTLRETLKDYKDLEDDDWEIFLDGVSLRPLRGEKWYWEVSYIWLPRRAALGGKPSEFHVFILMDGSVVELKQVNKKEENKKKE